ncbi:EAL domain-containing protein [Amphritea sp. 1_MG-2023]|uniref:bifunctional diguanylate cyclase/phosphodiesterase n=1 Tax=Amphritea sp. 1_MG-2023 TaxID=3062670 RepID=UPI0026E24173|nr:EAL domain-containing protein [Amphritea sp. 1_MG-2023]MDO6563734.1 EAL domain-containing protein [Amphritea sp. 1_MG-2023]
MVKSSAHSRFLSLRWKIFILLVVVLVGVQGMYAFFSLSQLNEQFRVQREQINLSEVARLDGSVKSSYQRLLEVAELLPLIDSRAEAHDSSPLTQLSQMITRQFDAFQLTGSVNSAYLYDNHARMVGFWGEQVDVSAKDIQQVYDTERPLRKLVCTSVCLRYVAIPIQMAGEKQGVLMVGRFLYDVIYDIKQQTKLDIGLALQTPGRVGELDHWGLSIDSLTNRVRNQELLEQLSLQQAFNPAGGSYVLEYNDRYFEVLFSPLQGVSEGHAYWVVLDDISGHLQSIRQSLMNYLLLGLGGILTALVLLSLLLEKPIQFFTQLAEEMSRLSRGEFSEFRITLGQFRHRDKIFGEDERDLLVQSSIVLSEQLEKLEDEVDERTDSLERSRLALTQERDFLFGLMETAPLVIITQNAKGHLRSVNHFGLQLMSLDSHSFRKATFIDTLQREEERLDFLTNTQRLVEGLETEVRTDSVLLDESGNRHDLSWIHVRLRESQDEPLMLSIGMDISDRKLAERRLQWLVNHDPLTERPNRLFFMSCLNDAIGQSRAPAAHIAVLFVDLDRFKEVNDSLGHAVGDKLLKVATRRIGECIRDNDLLARQGGDEFSVLLTSIRDLEGAEVAASKILQAFQQPFKINEYEIVVTVSIGISLFPDHGTDAATLIKHADVAMFQAKDAGKNCYYIYDVEKDHQRFERFSLGADLRKAIQNDELVLYYQPQVDAVTHRVVGAEALVRWQHPTVGLLSPDRFIPLAEELDLIIPLGEWVLREACRQMQAWIRAGLTTIKVSVNLAGQQIAHKRLIDSVEEALQVSGLSPERLELEVTENFVIRQPEMAIGKLTYLREQGITLAMDDFGTGYSSLSYLKKLPIDRLKIDRSFVKDIGIDHSDESIIKATLAMCDSLGLEVVAEGVETREQLVFLQENNCQIIQGYYFSKPLPADVFMQYMSRSQPLTDS